MSAKCRFYYEDSYRKTPRKECRLVDLNPASEPWQEKLCSRCSVPKILERNRCANLALEAEVTSRWGLFPRVSVLAVCTVKVAKIDDPSNCRHSCRQFKSLV